MLAPLLEPYQLMLLAPTIADVAAIEAVWSASQDADEPLGRPRDGWWSITSWASFSRLLLNDGEIVGVAAIEYNDGPEAAEARVALLPAYRQSQLAERLIHATVDLARERGAPLVRLYSPTGATWATTAAQAYQFRVIRTQHIMLRSPNASPLPARQVPGVMIRRLRDGEEGALLAALNRGWSGTWNFRPLTLDVLLDDLRGERDGMLVAVDEADQACIMATIHAQFDRTRTNPDGAPYAWISNLTTDPAARGRGLGRAMLAAGIQHLRTHGAQSVALGVDGGAAIPLTLYQSFDFQTVSTVEVWERSTAL